MQVGTKLQIDNPKRQMSKFVLPVVVAVLVSVHQPCMAAEPSRCPLGPRGGKADFTSLRLAVIDLMEAFGEEYPRGREFLDRLDALEAAGRSVRPALRQLRQEALLANPLLDFGKLIF